MRMSPTITALLDWVEKQAAPTLDAHCCIVTAIEGRQLAAAVREELISPDALPLLLELVALVRGECPALLDEDRGGDARLCMAIDDALDAARKEKAGE
jgi:hypothetical protein